MLPQIWVFLGIAETIVGSLLFCGAGIFSVLSIVCLRHLLMAPVRNTNKQTLISAFLRTSKTKLTFPVFVFSMFASGAISKPLYNSNSPHRSSHLQIGGFCLFNDPIRFPIILSIG